MALGQVLQDHRGFADYSEYPWLSDLVDLTAAEALAGVVEPTLKPIENDGIPIPVDHVLHLAGQARATLRGQAALEHRELYAYPVLFQHLGHSPKPCCSLTTVCPADVVSSACVKTYILLI